MQAFEGTKDAEQRKLANNLQKAVTTYNPNFDGLQEHQRCDSRNNDVEFSAFSTQESLRHSPGLSL